MQDTYQGHIGDGSSVQKHSAGGLYPFVLYAQETSKGLYWGFIHPDNGESFTFGTYDMTVEYVERLKAFRDAEKARARRVRETALRITMATSAEWIRWQEQRAAMN